MSKYLIFFLVSQVALGSIPVEFASEADNIGESLNVDKDEAEHLRYGNFHQMQDIVDRVTSNGYPIETHSVRTDDGYIITMHRIPHGLDNNQPGKKPVIFLVHGILMSSADWIIMGPGKGLAYILADSGYDVWMANARGNTYSRSHVILDPNSRRFWNFSWHEIGYYDLPRSIDFILEKTGQTALDYVGFSQGTTSFFILTSLRPEYNQKIRTMHALSPVAYMAYMKNPFFRALAPYVAQSSVLRNLLGYYEFLPSTTIIDMAGAGLCRDQYPSQAVCENIIFLIAGYNTDNLNSTMLPDIFENVPAGCSAKQIIHYAQSHVSHRFRQYNYGVLGNLIMYKSVYPPNYPLHKVTSPIFLYYANNDWISAPEDVQTLANQLQNVRYNELVADLSFNHLDFTWGINVKEMVYDNLLRNLERGP